MPERRLSKTRETLPAGYKFGDAKWTAEQLVAARDVDRWFKQKSGQILREAVACICDPYLTQAVNPAVGEVVWCPAHPQRTIHRGPSADC